MPMPPIRSGAELVSKDKAGAGTATSAGQSTAAARDGAKPGTRGASPFAAVLSKLQARAAGDEESGEPDIVSRFTAPEQADATLALTARPFATLTTARPSNRAGAETLQAPTPRLREPLRDASVPVRTRSAGHGAVRQDPPFDRRPSTAGSDSLPASETATKKLPATATATGAAPRPATGGQPQPSGPPATSSAERLAVRSEVVAKPVGEAVRTPKAQRAATRPSRGLERTGPSPTGAADSDSMAKTRVKVASSSVGKASLSTDPGTVVVQALRQALAAQSVGATTGGPLGDVGAPDAPPAVTPATVDTSVGAGARATVAAATAAAGTPSEAFSELLVDALDSGSTSEAVIRLEDGPAGPVTARLRMDGADLTVQLIAHDQASRQQLVDAAAQVRRELEQAELVPGEVQVSVGSDGHPDDSGADHAERPPDETDARTRYGQGQEANARRGLLGPKAPWDSAIDPTRDPTNQARSRGRVHVVA